MEKGSMYSSKASGRFTAWAFAATLAFGISSALATDVPAAAAQPAAAAVEKPTQGVVAEKAIDAHGGGDCAKAKEDCPKEAKADCCKKCAKGVKGAGHHKHDHKGAEAKAGAAGSTDKPAANPAEAAKGAAHPG